MFPQTKQSIYVDQNINVEWHILTQIKSNQEWYVWNFIHLNGITLMVKTIEFVITDCITTFEVWTMEAPYKLHMQNPLNCQIMHQKYFLGEIRCLRISIWFWVLREVWKFRSVNKVLALSLQYQAFILLVLLLDGMHVILKKKHQYTKNIMNWL